MSWRVAKSLDKLLTQINAMAPKRSKVSDGSIGDPAHSSRESDHNPNSAGVVCARDFTHDPTKGADMNKIMEAIRRSKDNRVKYVIWNRQMYSSYSTSSTAPFAWRPYSGSNPHTRHAHVSVQSQPSLYDNTRSWTIRKPKKWHLSASKDGTTRKAVYVKWTKARDWIRTQGAKGWRVVARRR